MDPADLLRYLDDPAPSRERRDVEEWLAGSDTHRSELAVLERAWNLPSEASLPAFDQEALWDRIRERLDGARVPPPESRVTAPVEKQADVAGRNARPARRPSRPGTLPVRTRWTRRIVRGAVGAAVIAIAALLLQDVRSTSEGVPEGPMRAYATDPGQIARLVLRDGSKVVLSGATTLRVPASFGDDSRDVYLDGVASFEVVHHASGAFRVHTSRLTAEVLGTRFAVVGYASDDSEQVAVAEGTVTVAGNDSAESVILHANDVAHVSAAGTVSATRDVAIDRYFSWIDGKVLFDQDYVADAAMVIQRHFGIEIHIADSALARRRFTGSIAAATLYSDLRGLAILLDANYEREGRVVTLSPR